MLAGRQRRIIPQPHPIRSRIIEGVFALRDEFLGKEWGKYSCSCIEGIVNGKKKIVVGFTNVDTACKDEISPQPISPKGLASKRACSGDIDSSGQNEYGQLPLFPSRSLFYYLMVDKHGNAELSSPLIRDGGFSAFHERIYLRKGMELKGEATPSTPKEPVSGDPNPTRTSK